VLGEIRVEGSDKYCRHVALRLSIGHHAEAQPPARLNHAQPASHHASGWPSHPLLRAQREAPEVSLVQLSLAAWPTLKPVPGATPAWRGVWRRGCHSGLGPDDSQRREAKRRRSDGTCSGQRSRRRWSSGGLSPQSSLDRGLGGRASARLHLARTWLEPADDHRTKNVAAEDRTGADSLRARKSVG
jgi:hypothetical protein